MSVLRISRPGYPTELIPLDDGASPGYRSKLGIKGGGPPIVFGSYPVGKSRVTNNRDRQREFQARKRVEP